MLSHLKVKVHSLAAEMTYIRRQEEKWKTKARYARQKRNAVIVKNVDWVNDPDLRDKATNNAIKLQYAEENFWSQHWHRYELKDHARITHLAYGAMRGVPYSRMEVICYGPLKGFGGSEPQWTKIGSVVERFAKDEPNQQEIMQRFSEWLADAQKWYESNPERIIAMNNARLAARAVKPQVWVGSGEVLALLLGH